jgi:hypothetical protein
MVFYRSRTEFLVIAFVTNFIICVSESVGLAVTDVTGVLDVVYNLRLKNP